MTFGYKDIWQETLCINSDCIVLVPTWKIAVKGVLVAVSPKTASKSWHYQYICTNSDYMYHTDLIQAMNEGMKFLNIRMERLNFYAN